MSATRVEYLNNADACFAYAVGAGGVEEMEDVKVVAREICVGWQHAAPEDIAVKIVSGGITNRLFRLTWREQSIENMLFALLSKQGFAPTYHGRFTNGRIEGWMDARPLEPEEMGSLAPINFLGMIGKELGRMHAMHVPLERTPVLWTKIDQFEHLASEIAFPNDAAKRAALAALDNGQRARRPAVAQVGAAVGAERRRARAARRAAGR
ncbi:hypothetical protein PINS_up023882 [Pythium insidiosum]|nr:hypothetical protein PINS_up023882 [Pythium insidiosum]